MTARKPDLVRWLAVLVLTALVPLPAWAGDEPEMQIDARLVWGTNDPKSPNTNCVPVNPELARKFRKTFKWQHYFLITNIQTRVAMGEMKSVVMSEHCTLKIKNQGHGKIEVKLIGEGNLVGHCTNPLTEGEQLVLGGDCKNNTAWFVVLCSRSSDAVPGKSRTRSKPKDPANSTKDRSHSAAKEQGAVLWQPVLELNIHCQLLVSCNQVSPCTPDPGCLSN